MTSDDEVRTVVVTHRRALGDVLAGLSAAEWDAPSLCEGWRVREVVAHLTMPFRYPTPRFLLELARSGGRFERMSDRIARRDARASVAELLDGWQSNLDHPWTPPGGGHPGALTHDVAHGLDITVALGIDHRIAESALRTVLDLATTARSRRHFGADLAGIRLEADDLDWVFGDGRPLRGHARDLLLVLMNRRLPADHLSGEGGSRFTAGRV